MTEKQKLLREVLQPEELEAKRRLDFGHPSAKARADRPPGGVPSSDGQPSRPAPDGP